MRWIEPAGEGGVEPVGKRETELPELTGLEFTEVNCKETIGMCVVGRSFTCQAHRSDVCRNETGGSAG